MKCCGQAADPTATSATVEVDGRRYGMGVRGLEPVGGGNGPEEAAVGLD